MRVPESHFKLAQRCRRRCAMASRHGRYTVPQLMWHILPKRRALCYWPARTYLRRHGTEDWISLELFHPRTGRRLPPCNMPGINPGDILRYRGEPKLCAAGLHAAPSIEHTFWRLCDAWVTRVAVWGDTHYEWKKSTSQYRMILYMFPCDIFASAYTKRPAAPRWLWWLPSETKATPIWLSRDSRDKQLVQSWLPILDAYDADAIERWNLKELARTCTT